MKREFKADMQVVRFGAEDVIATSGKTLTMSQFGDGVAKNGIVGFDGKSYTIDSANAIDAFMNAFGSFYAPSTHINAGSERTNQSLESVLNLEVTRETGVKNSAYNGTYVYDGSEFKKQ